MNNQGDDQEDLRVNNDAFFESPLDTVLDYSELAFDWIQSSVEASGLIDVDAIEQSLEPVSRAIDTALRKTADWSFSLPDTADPTSMFNTQNSTYNFGPDFACWTIYGKVVANRYQLPVVATLMYLAYLFIFGNKYIQKNPFGRGSHRSSGASSAAKNNKTNGNASHKNGAAGSAPASALSPSSPLSLMILFAAWNYFLAVFSVAGVYYSVPYVYESLRYQYYLTSSQKSMPGSSSSSSPLLGEVFSIIFQNANGWRYLICSDEMMFDTASLPSADVRAPPAACYGMVGTVMSLFMLSKFAELLDTVLLIALKKRVAFLHWYHHATVLLYGWHAYTFALPTSLLVGVMNYCVHSIMYFYFGMMGSISVVDRLSGGRGSGGRRGPLELLNSLLLKPLCTVLRMPITVIQLSQMVLGCIITYFAYIYTYRTAAHSSTSGHAAGEASRAAHTCSPAYNDSYYFELTATLYCSYLLLFSKLFIDSYLMPGNNNKNRSPKDKTE